MKWWLKNSPYLEVVILLLRKFILQLDKIVFCLCSTGSPKLSVQKRESGLVLIIHYIWPIIRYLSTQLKADEIFNKTQKRPFFFQFAVLFHSTSSQEHNAYKIKAYFMTIVSMLFIFICTTICGKHYSLKRDFW